MIYLNKAFFKPMLILLSVLFLPAIIDYLFLLIGGFSIEMLVIFVLLLSIYILPLCIVFNLSRSKSHYLKVDGNFLEINYPIRGAESPTVIEIKNIVKVEYYKILSIRSWCLLFHCIGPQSTFITYLSDGKEIRNLIGYPDLNELRQVFKDINLNVVMK